MHWCRCWSGYPRRRCGCGWGHLGCRRRWRGLGWGGGGGVRGGFWVCGVVGITGALLAGVHGGDLKLLAALGALVGFGNVCSIALLALVLALAYALLNLMLLGRLNVALRIAAQRTLELLYLRRFHTP